MKIIVIKENSYNIVTPNALYDWMAGVCLKADSALLKGGKPFFVPDYLGEFMAQPYWVIRLCRLGKSIPARFAHRYYDAVTLGVNIYGTELAEGLRGRKGFTDISESLDGTAVIGDFEDMAAISRTPSLEINGVRAQSFYEYLNGNQVLMTVNTTVERLSGLMTLRQGDLLYVPALGKPFRIQPGLHLSGSIGEKCVLEFNIK